MSLDTAYCACTTEKTKTRTQMSGKFAHTMRLHTVTNADPEKRVLNEILIGDETIQDVFKVSIDDAYANHKKKKYKTYEDYANEAKALVEEASGRKVRKDAVLEIEIVLTYSPSANGSIPMDEWKKANVEWLQNYFGKDNVISAVLHMDETTPHIHAMVTPIDREKGQPTLNAKKWLGGRTLMRQMQTDYGKAMAVFGLKRGEMNTRATHQDLQTFYKALNNVVRQRIPDRNMFPSDERYMEEIELIYKENRVRMFALEQTIKRLEAIDQTRENNHSIFRQITESQIHNYEEQIAVLTSNLSESEKKSKVLDYMQDALLTLGAEAPDEAKAIRERLNQLIEEGKKKDSSRKDFDKQLSIQ